MQKTILTIIGVAVIAVGAWYLIFSDMPSKKSVNRGDAVAMVNGEEISRSDFETFKSQVAAQQGIDIASLDAEAQSQFETQLVDELVAQELLRQAVNASGTVASQAEVDARIDATISQLGGNEAFEQALVAEELSEDAFREQVSAGLATEMYLEQELHLSSITATDGETEALYAQATAQGGNVPPLEDVRPQVEQSVIQQKQQSLLAQFIEKLRTEANIEILL